MADKYRVVEIAIHKTGEVKYGSLVSHIVVGNTQYTACRRFWAADTYSIDRKFPECLTCYSEYVNYKDKPNG